MQSVTEGALPGMPHHLDITQPDGEVQIQIRADGKVLWVHVEGATVLRICRIGGGIKIDDAREMTLEQQLSASIATEQPKYTQSDVDEMLAAEYQAGFEAGENRNNATE